MSILLRKEIDEIKDRILDLGSLVEERVHLAMQAVEEHDEKLAKRIIDGDPEVDRMEVSLEEECLKLLALHQPVANDLRFILSVIKINSDLERIGDLAVNIAERAVILSPQKKMEIPVDFPLMREKVKAMLRHSLDSLVNNDLVLAFKVWKADDEVDAINRKMYQIIARNLEENPKKNEYLLHLLGVSRSLERIADHATNIAEDVIYMIKGEIVRHKSEDFRASLGKG
jgi:phosphate transport system protein